MLTIEPGEASNYPASAFELLPIAFFLTVPIALVGKIHLAEIPYGCALADWCVVMVLLDLAEQR